MVLMMPNLKDARKKKKLEEFIKEHESDPEGDLDKLDEIIKSKVGKDGPKPAPTGSKKQ